MTRKNPVRDRWAYDAIPWACGYALPNWRRPSKGISFYKSIYFLQPDAAFKRRSPSPETNMTFPVFKDDLSSWVIHIVPVWVLVLVLPPGQGQPQVLPPLLVFPGKKKIKLPLISHADILHSRVDQVEGFVSKFFGLLPNLECRGRIWSDWTTFQDAFYRGSPVLRFN